jgi:glycopeptide antibiotics resistance protein
VLLLFGARAWWVGMLGGFLASCAIETVQALFLPARFASVDDVLSNTSGAVLGVLLGIVVLGRARVSAAGGQSRAAV